MEYVYRFVRLASRYEEDTLGTTTIKFPGSSFTEGPGDTSQLGTGIVFLTMQLAPGKLWQTQVEN